MPLELAGAALGFLLTLAVLSYVIGDNPAYRAAVHTFVGAAAGYAVIVALVNVLLPQMAGPLAAGWGAAQLLPAAVGWLLAALLVWKWLRPGSVLGRLPVAYLAGVGAAAAVGGAVAGTVFPQTAAAFVSLLPAAAPGADALTGLEGLLSALILLAGTLSVLLLFWYGGRVQAGGRIDRPALLRPVAWVGQVFLGLTLGVLYAGALAASLAYLAERLASLAAFVRSLAGG